MAPAPRETAGPVNGGGRAARALAAAGLWLRDHQRFVRRLQWAIIVIYAALLLAPLVTPAPTRSSRILGNATLFAQFAFWGVWWPFVLVSVALTGRTWCGLFCPEGALAEIASARSRGRAVPRWIRWPGWPFVAFAGVTIYGQMTSVYQYPLPALVVLGGSTLAAIVTGLLYGRDKRVWCRYLCPVNGVFALLARLAPARFRVDRAAWDSAPKPDPRAPRLNCAPLVPVRAMEGAAMCHMCGRCAGFRNAVTLAPRPPEQEIVTGAGGRGSFWETALIVFGLMGIAAGAFAWTVSPWYVAARTATIGWLVDHDLMWPLQPRLPWWILTNYPQASDVMTPADGAVMAAYILATAAVSGGIILACLAAATRALGQWRAQRLHHLALGLTPLAGCGVFLGLSAITLTQLHVGAPAWVAVTRATLLAAAAWSLRLQWRISGQYARALPARLACLAACSGAAAMGALNWIALFWLW